MTGPILATPFGGFVARVKARAERLWRVEGQRRLDAARLAAMALPRCTHPDRHGVVHGAASHSERSALRHRRVLP